MMRQFRQSLSVLVLGLLLCTVLAVKLDAAILIGSLSTVTTAQTNSPTFQTNIAYINLPQVSVSNNGLATTNAYTGYFRWSLDNTTFYTNGSPAFNPSTTNAGTATIAPQTVAVPIYIQMVAITNAGNTSTIQIGASTP